jgi:hypothetical protein
MDRAERIAYHHEKGEWRFPGQQAFLRRWRLYRSAHIGHLRGEATLRAGEAAEIRLRFTATAAIPPQTWLRLFSPGFNPYNYFNPEPADGKATVVANGPDGPLPVEPDDSFNRRVLWILLNRGLKPAEAVDLVLGQGKTFQVSQVTLPIRFYIEAVIGRDSFEPDARLVDMVELSVAPAALAEVHLLTDPVVRPGQAVDLLLRGVDRFGNPADEAVLLEFGDQARVSTAGPAHLEPGDNGTRRLRAWVTPHESGVTRLSPQTKSNVRISVPPILCRSRSEEPFFLAFGDLHCHDYLSPGGVSPMDYYENARAAGLHVLALPVQTHGKNLDARKWAIATAAAESYDRPGAFVAIPAFEWQHYAFGHKNVYFLHADQPYLCPYDRRYDTVEKLYAAARQTDALILPHHSGYGLDRHVPGTDWSVVDDTMEPVAEICSVHGISESADSDRPLNLPGSDGWLHEAWARGKHVGVIGGSDSHSGLPVRSPREPRPYSGGMTCLYVEELTRRGVFEAIRSRRTYATTGARIIVDFRLNGHRMGECLPPTPTRVLRITVHGTDTVELLEVVRNNNVWKRIEPGTPDATVEYTDHPGVRSSGEFYYVRLRQRDGEWAWSSPIWVAASNLCDNAKPGEHVSREGS